MKYTDVISSIGSIATAGALIWAFIQHRADNRNLEKKMQEEKKKYKQERVDFELSQIEIKIHHLEDRFNRYTEIFLITEKLNWAFLKMKTDIMKVNVIHIEEYEMQFTNISNLLNELDPWQQAIIGDLPIDPLINKYYNYYDYKENDDFLSWIEHFEGQVQEAADEAHKIIEKTSELRKILQDRLMQL